MPIKNLIRDPLTHFLAVGLALYVILGALNPAQRNERISVDEESLLEFYQYRANVFQEDATLAVLAKLNDKEKQRLLTEYIREEVFMREAQKLRLDRDDYVIRRRMAQKAEYLASASQAIKAPSETELRREYERTKSQYISSPRITFTHIFLSTTDARVDQVFADASTLLPELKALDTSFQDSGEYGDRFPYHRNYVERPFAYVEAHFGAKAAEMLFSPTAALNEWRGPIRSDHGVHLVFVSEVWPQRQQGFEEVRGQVKDALRQERETRLLDDALNEIIRSYSVFIDPALQKSGWVKHLDD